MSVVPAMLAERLGLPQVTLGSRIERKENQLAVQRDGDTATEVVIGTDAAGRLRHRPVR